MGMPNTFFQGFGRSGFLGRRRREEHLRGEPRGVRHPRWSHRARGARRLQEFRQEHQHQGEATAEEGSADRQEQQGQRQPVAGFCAAPLTDFSGGSSEV